MLPLLSDTEVVLLPRGGAPAARPPGEAEEQSVGEAPAPCFGPGRWLSGAPSRPLLEDSEPA